MGTIWAAWSRFWLPVDHRLNLAAMRVIVGLHGLWIVTSRDLAGGSAYPEFWTEVSNATRWRFLLFEGHPGLENVLQWLLVLALIGVVLGWFARPAAFGAALLLYHLAPLETIFWTASPYARGTTLTVLALVLLAASPSSDALAVRQRATNGTEVAWHYGWPIQLMALLVCQIFLFSAYAKLVTTGLSWGSAENMTRWLYVFGFDEERVLWRSAAAWIDANRWAASLFGYGAFAFEAFFVTALFVRRWRPIFVVAGLLFHVGIMVLTGIHVGEIWLLLVLLDWSAIGRFFPVSPRQSPIVTASPS